MANYDQVNKIVDGEKRELEQQLREEGDTLEGSFIQAAMQSLIVRNVLYRNKVWSWTIVQYLFYIYFVN